MSETPSAAPLLVEERPAGNGKRVAVVTLNAPATLNSLTLEMIDLLQSALPRLRADDDVACILIRGAGDRALCAGGDIQALAQAINRNHAAGEIVDDYAESFFEREYRLDYELHRCPTPIVVLGHGVVMGGGLGFFAAGSVRVVTQKSRIALPEITIGLFPDAGGSWLLGNLPTGQAAFIGLTGAHLNAQDAVDIGLGTHYCPLEGLDDVPARLAAVDWSADRAEWQAQAEAVFVPLPAGVADAQIATVAAEIDLGQGLDPIEGIRAQAGAGAYIDRAIGVMEAGCPTSLGVVCEELRRVRGLSIEACFQLEMVVATHCARERDFAEGVRALLVDKDNAPRWRYATLAELPAEHVLNHFEPPWPVNPLADLGA
ncbi:MAG: enoyl-CoA hydratase/isomerase family protein [Pseudomonadota bacterium]